MVLVLDDLLLLDIAKCSILTKLDIRLIKPFINLRGRFTYALHSTVSSNLLHAKSTVTVVRAGSNI